MNAELEPTFEIGLRHVLEDGLVLMREQQLADDRRQIVLKGLTKIFSGATRGSDITEANRLFARASDRPAVEAFALIFRYLHRVYGQELNARITETRNVLTQLRDGYQTDDQSLAQARDVIEKLLSALRRESALKPLPQEQIHSVN